MRFKSPSRCCGILYINFDYILSLSPYRNKWQQGTSQNNQAQAANTPQILFTTAFKKQKEHQTCARCFVVTFPFVYPEIKKHPAVTHYATLKGKESMAWASPQHQSSFVYAHMIADFNYRRNDYDGIPSVTINHKYTSLNPPRTVRAVPFEAVCKINHAIRGSQRKSS